MDLDLSDGAVVVTLSDRNLSDLALARAKGEPAHLVRMTTDGYLSIQVESDDDHYALRRPGPGLYNGEAAFIGVQQKPIEPETAED